MDVELFLVQAMVLIGPPLAIWFVVRKFEPMVVIWILWGIFLSPSALGRFAPEFQQEYFGTLPTYIGFIAVSFFLVLTGMHLDPHHLMGRGEHHRGHRGESREALRFWTIVFSSTIIPGILFALFADVLWHEFPELRGLSATRTTFDMAIGLSGAITALPVLSVILVELRLAETELGKFVLGIATVHDGLVWFVLAILLTIVENGSGHSTHGPLEVLMWSIIFIGVMFKGIGPLIQRIVRTEFFKSDVSLPQPMKLALIFFLMFPAMWVTHWIGIHEYLGAVIYGAVLPKEIQRAITKRVEYLAVGLLLPFFFVPAAARLNFDLTSGSVWMIVGMTTLLTYGAQFLGTTVPLHFGFKNTWNEAFKLGAFMACRGMVAIVVLGIMLEAQVVSEEAYASMILSAVAATALTVPIIVLVDSASGLATLSARFNRRRASVQQRPDDRII